MDKATRVITYKANNSETRFYSNMSDAIQANVELVKAGHTVVMTGSEDGEYYFTVFYTK